MTKLEFLQYEINESFIPGFIASIDTNFHLIGLDSLDEIELVMALEDHYSIVIPDEELDGVTTIGELLNIPSLRLFT